MNKGIKALVTFTVLCMICTVGFVSYTLGTYHAEQKTQQFDSYIESNAEVEDDIYEVEPIQSEPYVAEPEPSHHQNQNPNQ